MLASQEARTYWTGSRSCQFDKEVEPVDAGIDDIPAGALDFDEFQFADLAAVNAFQDLRTVVCHEEAMGYGKGQISGAYKLQDPAANGKAIGQWFFDEDSLRRGSCRAAWVTSR